uniref:Actin n=1 Tax=Arcella intermedia TaxID=1963864 RepID=A0A6B2L4V3_9EUKA
MTKAGHAGDDGPNTVFPTNVGCVMVGENYVGQGSHGVGEGAAAKDVEPGKPVQQKRVIYVGNEMSVFRSHMEIISPTSLGIVNDWDSMEKLWDHAIMERLRVDPVDTPLLFSEPSINTKEQREKLTELVFEKYKPKGFFVAKEATLSAYASGRSTALVVDSGSDMTLTVPVHDGYVLQKSIQRSPFAGSKITEQLYSSISHKLSNSELRPRYMFNKKQGKGKPEIQLIQRTGVTTSYHTYQLKTTLNDLKESICRVPEEPYDEGMSITMQSYELPDGTIIQLEKERYKLTDLMFQNISMPGVISSSIQDMIMNSISSADADIRKELFGGIIVTGGNTLFKGFAERLQKEVQNKNPPQMYKLKVISPADSVERRFSSWIGGSILASLGSFHQMWMSKQEYDEVGKSLVNLKCP